MKKSRVLSVIVAGISLIMLTGCGQKLGEEFTEEVNTLEGVEMTVDESLITPTGITFTISNQSDKELNYGQDYSILKEKEGRWYQVVPENPVAVTMELLWLPADNTDTHEISWETSYGKLSSGNYRIIKYVFDSENGYCLAGEFTIK